MLEEPLPQSGWWADLLPTLAGLGPGGVIFQQHSGPSQGSETSSSVSGGGSAAAATALLSPHDGRRLLAAAKPRRDSNTNATYQAGYAAPLPQQPLPEYLGLRGLNVEAAWEVANSEWHAGVKGGCLHACGKGGCGRHGTWGCGCA